MYDRINALNEFESIAREYTTIEIGDDLKRNETFNKLRSVLRAEIESHKNETDFEKHLDIAYIQGSLTLSNSVSITFLLATDITEEGSFF